MKSLNCGYHTLMAMFASSVHILLLLQSQMPQRQQQPQTPTRGGIAQLGQRRRPKPQPIPSRYFMPLETPDDYIRLLANAPANSVSVIKFQALSLSLRPLPCGTDRCPEPPPPHSHPTDTHKQPRSSKPRT